MDKKINVNETRALRAYRVSDFCEAYGIGRTSTYKLLRDGTLPSVKVLGRRLIPFEAAEMLLKGAIK